MLGTTVVEDIQNRFGSKGKRKGHAAKLKLGKQKAESKMLKS
jgi:hypothetical protein